MPAWADSPDVDVDVAALRPKVIIWDIDGTLWDGVIDASIGSVPRATVQLIKDLRDRGVVNSICSNNDGAGAKVKLASWDLLDAIVYEQFGWDDKLITIARMLDFFAVAVDRVVVVDDDPRVRQRLSSQLGVVTLSPEQVEDADLSGWGDSATGRERLEHYRVLARRAGEFTSYQSSAHDPDVVGFLRTTGTTVISVDVESHATRIAELSHRSNRLNLTESRLVEADVVALARDTRHRCLAFRVVDRFGDYGLCGFVAVRRDAPSFIHLFWSCRVLNQGVVEFVVRSVSSDMGCKYSHPALVDFGVPVDWVSAEVEAAAGSANTHELASGAEPPQVLLIGGCDMDIIAGLWTGATEVEVSGLGEESGVQQYGQSAIFLMVAQGTIGLGTTRLAQVPWIGNVPNPANWERYDLVVVSLWVDYSCSTIRHPEDPDGVVGPEYVRLLPESTQFDWDHWVGCRLSPARYLDEFVHGPPLTAGEIAAKLGELARLTERTRIVFLGAPELDRGVRYPHGADQFDRNRKVNSAVREECRRHTNTEFLELATVVDDVDRLIHPSEPTGFHFRRDVYAALSGSLERRTAVECGR